MSKKINIIRTDKSWITETAVGQLNNTAQLDGILQAVGLPDLHPGTTPVGAAYLTEDVIYPHIVGNDIGCGFALFSLNMLGHNFKKEKVIKKLNQLNALEDIDISGITTQYPWPFKEKLGTIGTGNHFAEFQKIDKVFDKASVSRLSLREKEVVLLIHSGSRTYGDYILNKFTKQFACQDGLLVNSEGFALYMQEHHQAFEFAKINRELIALRLAALLNFTVHNKLIDSVHNGIFPKEINGRTYFIHRKGATPADNGLAVIAGSRGTSSYLVEPAPDLAEAIYSISHGAGRKWPRTGCKERLEKMYSRKALRQDGLVKPNVICRDSKLIYQEAPEAYKNIERVIEDMLAANMIRLVARLCPLITYKV